MEKDLMEVPGFHPNEGSGFLHQMLLCAPSPEQRDGLFLGVLTILEVSLNWTVLSFLGSIPACPDLMTFVAGRSGAGKCIMNWVRQLAETSCQTPIRPCDQELELPKQNPRQFLISSGFSIARRPYLR